jgi:hypothetical protein
MSKFKRSAQIALFLCAGILSGLSARAEDVQIDGHALKLVPSGNFCALDRNQPAEDWLFDQIEKLQAERAQLIAFWSECPALNRYRSGESDSLLPYAMITVSRLSQLRTTKQSRVQYIAELRRISAGRAFNAGMKEGTKEAQEKIKRDVDELASQTGEAHHMPEVESLGMLLIEDEDAVYYGILDRAAADGNEGVRVAGVAAWTVIDGVVVTALVYDAFTGPESFELLKQKSQDLVHALLANNR